MIDETNRNTALASALVEELARSGVRDAVLSPGSRSSPVALALDREPDIRLSVVLDERCAGFLALGTALASGRSVLVACTSGSAAANLHPAVVEADQAGVPLIVLTSDRPPELRGIGTGQTIDQIGLYGSAARWFCEVGTHEADDAGLLHMRSTGCRAFAEASAGRGPVHLNLAWRDPLGPEPTPEDVRAREPLALRGRDASRPLTTSIVCREPSEALIVALSEALVRAKRPLIVAGRQTDPELPAAVAELATAWGVPILAEPASGLRFGPHVREGVIGAYDLIARSMPAPLGPDLVLRFGDMSTSKALRAWIETSGVDQIVIDPPGPWNEPTRRAGAFVRADAASVARALRERADQPASSETFLEGWTRAEQTAQRAIEETLAAAGPELSEPRVHRLLAELFGEGEQVLLASSMPVRDAEAFMAPGTAAVRCFANRGANGIDGLVSTACGLTHGGDAPTWLVIGDLALAHDLGGLACIRETAQPLRIVVIDNGGGGIFDFLPQATQVEPERFDRLFTTPSELDTERVAALFGLPFVEVADPDGLRSLAERGAVLARVRVERPGNVRLHRRLAEAVTAALG